MKTEFIQLDKSLETIVEYVPDMSTPLGRLKHLRHVVESVPEQAFDMNQYMNECGTAGCMLGWATVDPHFAARGLRMVGGYVRNTRHPSVDCSFDAAALALGVAQRSARKLFTLIPGDGESYRVTKSHGIARIDRLIAELAGHKAPTP